jgi:uncharacterized membrane protein YhaH (DUF805 family)
MEKSAIGWMLTPLQKYASFSGRARRAEYWWFGLFVLLATIVLTSVDYMLLGADTMDQYGFGPMAGIFSLGILVPSIAVSFRRLHDLDRSAWWVLIGLIPFIGSLILLFWYVQRGTVGDNRFGPDPVTGDD